MLEGMKEQVAAAAQVEEVAPQAEFTLDGLGGLGHQAATKRADVVVRGARVQPKVTTQPYQAATGKLAIQRDMNQPARTHSRRDRPAALQRILEVMQYAGTFDNVELLLEPGQVEEVHLQEVDVLEAPATGHAGSVCQARAAQVDRRNPGVRPVADGIADRLAPGAASGDQDIERARAKIQFVR